MLFPRAEAESFSASVWKCAVTAMGVSKGKQSPLAKTSLPSTVIATMGLPAYAAGLRSYSSSTMIFVNPASYRDFSKARYSVVSKSEDASGNLASVCRKYSTTIGTLKSNCCPAVKTLFPSMDTETTALFTVSSEASAVSST